MIFRKKNVYMFFVKVTYIFLISVLIFFEYTGALHRYRRYPLSSSSLAPVSSNHIHCSKNEFQCPNAHCINDQFHCDGIIDCPPDGNDEKGRTYCGENLRTLVANGEPAELSKFPWHATLYKIKNSTTSIFQCGASIIESNLLITAAHCVYNRKQLEFYDPENFVIMTRNIYRKWNQSYSESAPVVKANVTQIFHMSKYHDDKNGFTHDIVILKIDPDLPFNDFTKAIKIDENQLKNIGEGSKGIVVGFGMTEFRKNSELLQQVRIPIVSTEQCTNSSKFYGEEKFDVLDIFCAGYKNGSAVCKGDSGSGLVFHIGNQPYLGGIVSTGIGKNTTDPLGNCDNYEYARFVNISYHVKWIEDIKRRETGSDVTETKLGPSIAGYQKKCSLPSEIPNGFWKIHSDQCYGDEECKSKWRNSMIPGIRLDYFCNDGYYMTECGHVFCDIEGNWSDLPTCEEIRCPGLQSVSREANCSLNNQLIPCESTAVPKTQVDLRCRDNYQIEFPIIQSNNVTCNDQGQWNPRPIDCIPEPIILNINANFTGYVKKSKTMTLKIKRKPKINEIEKDKNDNPDIDVRIG